MKQLVVISGKGGTGKTSIVASLGSLAAAEAASGAMTPPVLADCDVDAANLGLLLPGQDVREEPFTAGSRAVVHSEACIGCALCEDLCRFGAMTMEGEVAVVKTLACEGCRVCARECPEEAIEMVDNVAGVWMERRAEVGDLVHARLGIAQDNSGKLVAQVRQRTREIAEEKGTDLVIIDGPPGIGCPVHAAVTGCDLVLVVTEPTPSGEHDLARVLDLAAHFQMKAAVVVNKHDLSPETTASIKARAKAAEAAWLGVIPFVPDVPRALARGELPLTVPSVRDAIEGIWRGLVELLEL